MSDEQLQMQGAEIDRTLFQPMADFFMHDNYNPVEFENYIFRTGYPIYRRRSDSTAYMAGWINTYRGFVLDAYVKHLLTRFVEATGCPFAPTIFTSGELRDGHVFAVSRWNNVSLYNRLDGCEATELDGLYEFKDRSGITPVILEVTFNSSARGVRFGIDKKRELVSYLYSQPSYLCKVTPAKGKQKPGLSGRKMPYRRDIRIPKRDFRPIVRTLCSLTEKSRNPAQD